MVSISLLVMATEKFYRIESRIVAIKSPTKERQERMLGHTVTLPTEWAECDNSTRLRPLKKLYRKKVSEINDFYKKSDHLVEYRIVKVVKSESFTRLDDLNSL
jgi:hypothetical protein